MMTLSTKQVNITMDDVPAHDELLSVTGFIQLCGYGDRNNEVSFSEMFGTVYLDDDREQLLESLQNRLRKLAKGTLKGQKNCFLVLGPRGLGKSQFLIALGQWFCKTAGSTGMFVYLDAKYMNKKFRYDTEGFSVFDAIRSIAVSLGWENLAGSTWNNFDCCHEWLVRNNKSIFLVLDEFDEAYKRLNCLQFFCDLTEIGGYSGSRRIIVIVSGSSAYLRPLCFCKLPHTDENCKRYPSYKGAPNFNSSKFLPMCIGPIRTIVDLEKAMCALKLTIPKDSSALLIERYGQIRQIMDENYDQDHHAAESMASFHIGDNKKILQLYLNHVVGKNIALVQEIVSGRCEFLAIHRHYLACPKTVLFDDNITEAAVYDCIDASYIREITSSEIPSIVITHQSYLRLLLLYFGRQHSTAINAAEKFCLLYPFNSGTDEVNEYLVAEALCTNGLTIPDIGHLSFKLSEKNTLEQCLSGVSRSTKNERSATEGACQLLKSSSSLGAYQSYILKKTEVQPAQLFKEYPDETGADLIAAFYGNVKSRKYSKKWIVIRVQINLGLSNSPVDKADMSAIQWMKTHEQLLLKAFGKANTPEDIIFVRVLWTSRPTNSVADADRVVIINSENMKWSPRVQNFVDDKKLTAYGSKK